MDGGAALPGQFFSGARNVKVVPAVSAISAGVAEGMLTHKTTPVYPEIAKSAHVSGTVVLGANITKTGQLSNLHVLSGPAMLRNTALEAVKTWHYRPYLLNNQPVEVETTIHVVFSLDR
jgi:protein TonB